MKKEMVPVNFMITQRRKTMLEALAREKKITFSAMARHSLAASFMLFENVDPTEAKAMVMQTAANEVADQLHFDSVVSSKVRDIQQALQRASTETTIETTKTEE